MKIINLLLLMLVVFGQSNTKSFVTRNGLIKSKRVMVAGTGYVGLISGGGLAEIGHQVTCVDIDQQKIEKLNQGIIPIYEPGVEEIVKKNLQLGRLVFSGDIPAAIIDAEIIIIAVGTPMADDGKADLRALKAVLSTIGQYLDEYKVICIKSTVPVGTNVYAKQFLQDAVGDVPFDVISNPEFLREGSALADFFTCNPIVVGSDSQRALDIFHELYNPLIQQGTPFIQTDFATAELIKYAWNGYSATKISYVNELCHLCNAAGADVDTVVLGMSYGEHLLPIGTVRPGPGIGGSCLPKDTNALVAMADNFGIDFSIVKTVIDSIASQKQKVVKKIYELLENNIEGKTVAVLGLSFKRNTDDIRYSPGIDVLSALLQGGALVKAYDPAAMNNMKNILPDVQYCGSAYEAIADADALVLLTDWDEFKTLDLERVAKLMKNKNIFDGRNMWSPRELKGLGFTFANLGRQS